MQHQYGKDWARKAPIRLCDRVLYGILNQTGQEVILLSQVSKEVTLFYWNREVTWFSRLFGLKDDVMGPRAFFFKGQLGRRSLNPWRSLCFGFVWNWWKKALLLNEYRKSRIKEITTVNKNKKNENREPGRTLTLIKETAWGAVELKRPIFRLGRVLHLLGKEGGATSTVYWTSNQSFGNRMGTSSSNSVR